MKQETKDDVKEQKEQKDPVPIVPACILQHVVDKLKPFGELVKLCPDSLELEARFMVRSSIPIASVSTNIPDSYFRHILQFVKRNEKQFVETIPWSESMDCFFHEDVRMTKEGKDGSKITWIKKQRLFNYDYLIPERPLAVRISLKSETTCEPLAAAVPVFIRKKKRTSFLDKTLRIDFTIVWQGKTEQECNTAKQEYEIEVEVINKQQLAEDRVPASNIVGDLMTRILELQGLDAPLSICEMTHGS